MQASVEQHGKRVISRAKGLESVQNAYKFADLSAYPFKKRLLIRVADLIFYILIRIIGRTTRFTVEGQEHWDAASEDGNIPIYTFWHNRAFLSTYYWQKRRIVIMISKSLDGEYIARCLQRFGCGAARGSSTRGAVGAIVEMVRLMRNGCPTGFAIDGPKGPRYEAKMGAVLLAKKTGYPILPFTITADKFWEAKSWDVLQVPKPFTRAHVLIAPPIYVAADSNDATMQAKRDELQRTLDELNRRGDAWRENKLAK